MGEHVGGQPLVRIVEGTWSGSSGPVVGIDQERGTVTVHIDVPGVTFGGRKGLSVVVDVRKVRRIDRDS